MIPNIKEIQAAALKAEARRDEIARRMLNTPPKPFTPPAKGLGKKKPAK